jgi:hypothetical protein
MTTPDTMTEKAAATVMDDGEGGGGDSDVDDGEGGGDAGHNQHVVFENFS